MVAPKWLSNGETSFLKVHLILVVNPQHVLFISCSKVAIYRSWGDEIFLMMEPFFCYGFFNRFPRPAPVYPCFGHEEGMSSRAWWVAWLGKRRASWKYHGESVILKSPVFFFSVGIDDTHVHLAHIHSSLHRQLF